MISNPKLLTAEIASVGTELLLGQIIDTHAPKMAQILAGCGIICQRRVTVGDNFERICDAFRESLSRADILITIGGLGPTGDDLTRDAIAEVLEDELISDKEYEIQLQDFFLSRGVTFAETNRRQAQCPTCGRFIENPNGTAPGLICEKNGKIVIALPGPAGEFNPMALGPVHHYLAHLQEGSVIHSRTLKVIGIGESEVESKVKLLMDGENPTVAPYAHPAEVHLRVTARASTVGEADRMINPVEAEIRGILGNAVFGADETTLEKAVIDLLIEKKQTVAVAESITGGGLGERFTSVPGSSKAFIGGVIAYNVSAKVQLLGLEPELVDKHGPVSEEISQAMAEKVRDLLGSDYGIGIVGNAGPSVDIDGKPVGLIFVSIVGKDGLLTCKEANYRGIREDIRRRTSQLALNLLRQQLLG